MKKLITLLFLISLTISAFSQGLFKPVPANLFVSQTTYSFMTPMAEVPIVKGKWIPRLNTGVMGVSWELKKGTKPVPFEAIGFGLGFLYYKNVNGEPFNVWGINALFLTSIDHTAIGAGLYGMYNTNQIGLVNLGFHYDAGLKTFFADTGLTYKF
jgi:hypothetical protein